MLAIEHHVVLVFQLANVLVEMLVVVVVVEVSESALGFLRFAFLVAILLMLNYCLMEWYLTN